MLLKCGGTSGAKEVSGLLTSIDVQARDSADPFDLFEAYDKHLKEKIVESGLVDSVRNLLRPGVYLVLHTRAPAIFHVETSLLNRLIAYATIQACLRQDASKFLHVISNSIRRDEAYVAAAGQPNLRVICDDGREILTDHVIVRWGTNRTQIAQPFNALLNTYKVGHEQWLKQHAGKALVPRLTNPARAFYEALADTYEIPRLHPQGNGPADPLVKIRLVDEDICWSGNLEIKNVASIWDQQSRATIAPDSPSDLGSPAALAVARMALHGNVSLNVKGPDWSQFMRELSKADHSVRLVSPRLNQQPLHGATENPEIRTADRISLEINQALDQWMLLRLHESLLAFIDDDDDPGFAIGLDVAVDIKQQMRNVWNVWNAMFLAKPSLLNSYLRLMVSAKSDGDGAASIQVAVGPRQLDSIVKGCAVALIVASVWQGTKPQEVISNNLMRPVHSGTWGGHCCVAERINNESIAIQAATFMWQASFVILPRDGGPSLMLAEESFAKTHNEQPAFDEAVLRKPILIYVSPTFEAAAKNGLQKLRALLEAAENSYYEGMGSEIQKVRA